MSETETDWSSRTGPVATAQLTRDDEGVQGGAAIQRDRKAGGKDGKGGTVIHPDRPEWPILCRCGNPAVSVEPRTRPHPVRAWCWGCWPPRDISKPAPALTPSLSTAR